MRKLLLITVLFNLLFSISNKSFSQSLPVGAPVLEEYYRRLQLLGKIDSSVSFTQRPLNGIALHTKSIYYPDAAESTHIQRGDFSFHGGRFIFLPITFQQQINSHHPFGWNDGAMIPAKGYQSLLGGGFYFQYGPLSIQLRPEYIYASNNAFTSFAEGRSNPDIMFYYGNYNYIDAPERFGQGGYKKFLWGQSNIRLTFGAVSVGLSNENLWWGPGINNSIMMSNNAPGFKHLTLNTVRPIKTRIGSFEAQIVGGKLEQSNVVPLIVPNDSYAGSLLMPFNNDWRYFSGLNLSYQPKWVPGLYLGFTRTFLTYHDALNSFDDYFPLLAAFQKAKINNSLGETTDRDQRTSLFTRWLFPKARAEVYFEYGLNDNSYNVRDFLGSPEHSRTYIFGLTKLIPINKKDQYVKVSAEVTQLSQTIDSLVRPAGSFYAHSQIRQGYTNSGQVLGAGIGTGGNLQSLKISWVKNLKTLGLSFDRYEHDSDYASSARLLTLNGISRRWIDFAVGAEGTWNYKNLLFNAKIQGVKSLNYQWVLKDYTPDRYYIPNNDVFNFHGELGVTYRF